MTPPDDTNTPDPPARLPRRDFLRSAAVTGMGAAALAVPSGPSQAQPAQPAPSAGSPAAAAAPAAGPPADVLVFFTPTETTLVTAIVDRLCPADSLSPSASELGVVLFLDRQLGGAFGGGAKTYRSGPWMQGSPNQGYQLPYAPAELVRQGLAEFAAAIEGATPGQTFESKTPTEQDRLLAALESGTLMLATLPGKLFFETLRTATIEGLFSDPLYGGNRGMKGWAMIGFPGVQLDWSGGFEQWRNRRVDLAPQSIADNL